MTSHPAPSDRPETPAASPADDRLFDPAAALSLIHDFEGFRTFTPGEQHLTHLQALVSQLESWATAMQGVREAKLEAAAAA